MFSVLGMELFGGQGANTCVNFQGFSDAELSTFNNGQIGMAPLNFGVLGVGGDPWAVRKCGGDYSCPTGFTCMAVGRTKGDNTAGMITHQVGRPHFQLLVGVTVAVRRRTHLPTCAYLPIHLPTCLPACLPACLPSCLPACLPTYRRLLPGCWG